MLIHVGLPLALFDVVIHNLEQLHKLQTEVFIIDLS